MNDEILQLLSQAMGNTQPMPEDQIRALRRQQAVGLLGSMAGGQVGQFGQNLYSDAQARMPEKVDPLERAGKAAGLARTMAEIQKWKDEANKPPEQTTLARNLIAAGYRPGTPEFQAVMMQALMKPETNINMGNIPGGYQQIEEPGTKNPIMRPVIGSKEYTAKADELNKLRRSRDTVNQMQTLLSKHGVEAYGPVSGQMRQLYGDILSGIAALRDMGVLQPGEVALLQSQLTDPGRAGSHMGRVDTIVAGYDQLLRQIESKIEQAQQSFKTWQHDIPPDPFAPKNVIKDDEL